MRKPFRKSFHGKGLKVGDKVIVTKGDGKFYCKGAKGRIVSLTNYDALVNFSDGKFKKSFSGDNSWFVVICDLKKGWKL